MHRSTRIGGFVVLLLVLLVSTSSRGEAGLIAATATEEPDSCDERCQLARECRRQFGSDFDGLIRCLGFTPADICDFTNVCTTPEPPAPPEPELPPLPDIGNVSLDTPFNLQLLIDRGSVCVETCRSCDGRPIGQCPVVMACVRCIAQEALR